jgi:hypothetical protein
MKVFCNYLGELEIAHRADHLNQMLSRGMCLSPPFNRAPSVCNENDETSKDGYYNEQFRFECFDWARHHVQTPGYVAQVYTHYVSKSSVNILFAI